MALTPAQERRLAAAEEAMADLRRSVAELISSLIASGRIAPAEDLLAKLKREDPADAGGCLVTPDELAGIEWARQEWARRQRSVIWRRSWPLRLRVRRLRRWLRLT